MGRTSVICEQYGHMLSTDKTYCTRPKCGYRPPKNIKTGMHALSPRELEVVEHILVDGYNKKIAQNMGIAEATVKRNIQSALDKTRLHNRTELALYALSKGWVKMPTIEDSEED